MAGRNGTGSTAHLQLGLRECGSGRRRIALIECAAADDDEAPRPRGVAVHVVGRFEAGKELRERIQARADELQLGVRILFVGLQDAHPPVKVAPAYEAVIGARQKREADILNAKAHSVRTNSLAAAESLRKKREAEGDRQRTETAAASRAALFTNQMQAFAASPTVYPQRAYLQALVRGGAGARKIILGTTNTQDVILLNLEEKIRADLLDVPLPAVKPK